MPSKRRPVKAWKKGPQGAATGGEPRAGVDRPPVRYMTVIAQDPSVCRDGRILTARVAVPAEDLIPGPIGYRVQVVDYDATERVFHGTHELPASYGDEPAHWKAGQPRLVGDFRFHAQNAYALVMRTLARFEFALGRRLGWSFETHQLKVAPHGMRDANAFYSPAQEGLVFGYFEGRSGPVYTALSHDVVVHETTHALLDALRERYMIPSNPDQAAFHEGFADVVALLSVFALPEVVGHLLLPPGRNGSPAKLISRKLVMPESLRESALFGLAEEMGQEIEGMRGEALRKSARLEPSPGILNQPEFAEPHRRGEVLVAAVMRAFVDAWSNRILASGTPNQREFPIGHVAEEGADVADALATLWIRAIDYMPPVHLTFSDALTAALTSDTRVRPDDTRFRLRHYLKRSFGQYGIRPVAAALGNDCWNPPPSNLTYDRVRFESLRSDKDEVFRFLWENQQPLELRTDAFTKVLSVRPCVRIGPDGFVLRETVAEYYQVARLTPDELADRNIAAPRGLLADIKRATVEQARKRSADPDLASESKPESDEDDDESVLPALYGGGVLIFDEYGQLKYHIHNDVFGSRQAGRLAYLWSAGLLQVKAGSAGYRAARLSTLHRLRAMDARKWPSEGW